MDYKIIKWGMANKLKERHSICFLFQLDFNLANIYLLSNWSYLVMPFAPFSNGLLTSKEKVLRKWIKERYFPVIDEADGSYFERSFKLKNLSDCKEGLKEALCDLVFKNNKRSPADLSAEEIDRVYTVLRYKDLFQKFKLNFTVLLGDYIISRRKDLDLRWGLLNDRQSLNPLVHPILVTDQKQQGYYELEKQLYGRKGYAGAEHYLQAVAFELENQAKEMVEVVGVMQ
jgi:hypothetical protein